MVAAPDDSSNHQADKVRLRRSMLYVPADNGRALAKCQKLAADVVVFDLEDPIAPARKAEARENVRHLLASGGRPTGEVVLRVNAIDTEWFEQDVSLAVDGGIDAVLLPKMKTAVDLQRLEDELQSQGAPPELRIWAMVETLSAIAEIAGAHRTFASLRRLDCVVAGTNDIAMEARLPPAPPPAVLVPWLMQIVLGARLLGLDVIDGTFNDIRDLNGFDISCRYSASMGFDGRSLIHPDQIATANEAFAPSAVELREAQSIVDAFGKDERVGVVVVNGRMVERLHLAQAQRCLKRGRSLLLQGQGMEITVDER